MSTRSLNPGAIVMPEPHTIDLAREDDLDTMQDAVEEAMYHLGRALWVEPSERAEELSKLARLAFRVARNQIEPDPVDGSVVTTVIRETGELLQSVFDRDPERMERREKRLRDAGKVQKADKLRAEIAEVRKRMAREARRGNE